MSLHCEYEKKINVKEDQRELEELTYKIDKELSEDLGEPNLQWGYFIKLFVFFNILQTWQKANIKFY